jgi:phenylacetate-CoA ligase
MDELLVRVEAAADFGDTPGGDIARLDALRALMRERLRARLGVHPVVELVPHGTLPRTEFKARRVVDDRDLYREALEKREA